MAEKVALHFNKENEYGGISNDLDSGCRCRLKMQDPRLIMAYPQLIVLLLSKLVGGFCEV